MTRLHTIKLVTPVALIPYHGRSFFIMNGVVMQTFHGSMKYDMHGRKRKTNAWKKAKPYKPKFKPLENYSLGRDGDDHREKYPSLSSTGMGYTPAKDQSYKIEESKNFTVAIGYNKGSYQVIPRDEIKSIGK